MWEIIIKFNLHDTLDALARDLKNEQNSKPTHTHDDDYLFHFTKVSNLVRQIRNRPLCDEPYSKSEMREIVEFLKRPVHEGKFDLYWFGICMFEDAMSASKDKIRADLGRNKKKKA